MTRFQAFIDKSTELSTEEIQKVLDIKTDYSEQQIHKLIDFMQDEIRKAGK